MSAGLSVVVPTHGRPDLVEALLASIAADAPSAGVDVQVLLVDDSAPDDAAAIRVAADRCGARVFPAESPNVGGKRNLGVARAAHDLILFLDSDVAIRPGTLRAHIERLRDASEDVAGCLGKVEFVGKETYPWKVIEAMQLTLPFAYPDVADHVPWGPTANLSVRRGPFLAIGGFDTTLPRYGGEDVDLGLRLTDRGLRIVTAREAVAEHAIATWSTWRQNLRRLWSFGLADYELLVRHPSRSFVDFPTGPMLWAAQVVVLLALLAGGLVRPGVALLALAASIASYPLVYAALKRAPGSEWRVHLLGPLVFWTMDAAKAVSAIRHRRPALIVRRLKFLDDLVAQDWPEIAASAWALTGSSVAFLAALIAGRLVQ